MTSIIKVQDIQNATGDNIIKEANNTITIGASGDTTNIVGTLQNNGAGVGGTMTPGFQATLTGTSQDISDASYTKVNCNTKIYDTASAYDNSSNFRFTPQTAGRYYVYGQVFIDSTAGNFRLVLASIYKNGSVLTRGGTNFHSSDSNDAEGGSSFIATTVDMNGSSDYLELYAFGDSIAGGTVGVEADQRRTHFGAYKIIE